MNGFAHRVIAAERERHVGYAATNQRMGQILFNPAASLNKVETIAIVLFNTGGHCKTLGSKIISSAGKPISLTSMS